MSYSNIVAKDVVHGCISQIAVAMLMIRLALAMLMIYLAKATLEHIDRTIF